MATILNKIKIQGHRGCRGLRPENTLSAAKAALESGADLIEIDLMLTKDGQIIVHHDFSLEGALISSLTLAEIKEFDCGSKKHPDFPRQIPQPGEKIPTLEEFCDFLDGRMGLNLEMKIDHRNPEVFAKKLVQLLQKKGLSKKVYYSSFRFDALKAVRNFDPKAVIALLQEEHLEGLVESALALKAEILSPEHILIPGKEWVGKMHKQGFKVVTWTVNETIRARDLFQMGIDGVITDYPKDLASLFH